MLPNSPNVFMAAERAAARGDAAVARGRGHLAERATPRATSRANNPKGGA